jgi:ornithine--oxo-acid transaminase
VPVIKLLPPSVVGESGLDWTPAGLAAVIGDNQGPGSMFDLGRTLAGHALRARAGAA